MADQSHDSLLDTGVGSGPFYKSTEAGCLACRQCFVAEVECLFDQLHCDLDAIGGSVGTEDGLGGLQMLDPLWAG